MIMKLWDMCSYIPDYETNVIGPFDFLIIYFIASYVGTYPHFVPCQNNTNSQTIFPMHFLDKKGRKSTPYLPKHTIPRFKLVREPGNNKALARPQIPDTRPPKILTPPDLCAQLTGRLYIFPELRAASASARQLIISRLRPRARHRLSSRAGAGSARPLPCDLCATLV